MKQVELMICVSLSCKHETNDTMHAFLKSKLSGENRPPVLSMHFIVYPHISALMCTKYCFVDQKTKIPNNAFPRAHEPMTIEVQVSQPQSLYSNHLAMCQGGLAES